MKKQELTPWFDSNVKPLRDGVYEIRFSDGRIEGGFAWFERGLWSNSFFELCQSSSRRGWNEGAYQDKEWRGLAQDPSKQ